MEIAGEFNATHCKKDMRSSSCSPKPTRFRASLHHAVLPEELLLKLNRFAISMSSKDHLF